MNRLVETVLLILKASVFFVWAIIKALIPKCRSNKARPDFGADICLVTGGGQGLGRDLALKFAECGATMVLWDINKDKMEAVADEIREMGNEVFTYLVNCGDRKQVYRAANQVREQIGDVAILVNNAGVVSGKKLLENSDAAIENTFKVNTLAHYWTVKAFLPWMVENNYGCIVQICSVCAFVGLAGLSDYCASKSASLMFAETLRTELRASNKNGVNVTCVCPYHIKNSQMFSGAKPRLPWLFKGVDSEEVAERTLRAVVEKQFLVAIPRTFYLSIFMKSFLPTQTMDCILRAIGSDECMDSFEGHGNVECS